MAPYCAIPRDYLSDTPLLRAMGFLVSQHGQLGAIPPPPCVSISPWRAFEVEVRYPPRHMRGISARCHVKTRPKRVRYPPLRTISKRYCAIGGGLSRTGLRSRDVNVHELRWSRGSRLRRFGLHCRSPFFPGVAATRSKHLTF